MDMSLYEKMTIEELRSEVLRLIMQLTPEECIEVYNEVMERRKP